MKVDNDSIQQRTWDKILLGGWRHDAPVSHLVGMYLQQLGEFQDGLLHEKLRRFPHNWHYTGGTRRFVAALLPVLSEKLWNGKNDADIIFWLYVNGEKIETLRHAIDKHKSSREKTAWDRDKRTLAVVRYTKEKSQEDWNRYKASGQWGVYK